MAGATMSAGIAGIVVKSTLRVQRKDINSSLVQHTILQIRWTKITS